MIRVEGISCGYAKRKVLSDVSVSFENGAFTAVIGPNGCGKTTLLRAISGEIPLIEGKIEIDGTDMSRMSRKNRAKHMGRFYQERAIPDMTVRNLAEAGRYPYMPFAGRMGNDDRAAVDRALAKCGVSALAQRMLCELSGGERQKAYMAMLLSQEAQNIMLDEPAAFLDPAARFEMMDMLRGLADEGYAVGVVMHDIALTMEYADSIILINGGSALQGSPDECMQTAESVFGIRLERTVSGAYALGRCTYQGEKLQKGG